MPKVTKRKAKMPKMKMGVHKSRSGGLTAKGVAAYRRANPGSKLKTAVTTPPSKLKKGSKAAKRRKSFCARMKGVKGPMRKPNGRYFLMKGDYKPHPGAVRQAKFKQANHPKS